MSPLQPDILGYLNLLAIISTYYYWNLDYNPKELATTAYCKTEVKRNFS
jgi:hypothetical protein